MNPRTIGRTAVWTLAVLTCFQAGSSARAAGKAAAGVVIAITGKPQVKPAQGGSFSKLRLNQFVYEGDTVKTAGGERVAVAFIGGAEIRINENSTFEMQSGGGSGKPISVATKVGQAWTRLLHGKTGGLNVVSPMAVCAVRGTEADVDVDQRLAVKVYEGYVDVYNDQGKSSLQAGQMTEVAGAGAAPEAPKAMTASDYGSWQNSLKPTGVDEKLQKLNQEADRIRNLEIETTGPDGQKKKVKLQFEKKQP